MNFIGNAFSLQMLVNDSAVVKVDPADWNDVPLDAVSCIGHPDTAAVASSLAGRDIPCQRSSVKLNPGDVIYVLQVLGGRLPEGATTLPDGVQMVLKKVTIVE